jgi:esterase/lipase
MRRGKLPVLYCIHGFGVRKTVEFDHLKDYFEAKDHEVILVELFDQSNDLDTDPQVWIQRARDGLETLLKQKRKVWLVGFSMGGVIASELATEYLVERVVLLAPAFEYVSLQTVKNVAEGAVRSIIKKPKPCNPDFPPMPDGFSIVFRNVVALCKDSITRVSCPVLFLHGSEDEVIPLRSSQNAYSKLPHEQKMLLIIEGVMHRIMDDDRHNQDVFCIMNDFFHARLIKNNQT